MKISFLLISLFLISCKTTPEKPKVLHFEKGDTLSYKEIKIADSSDNYFVNFNSIQFDNSHPILNHLINTLLFDSTGSEKAYLNKSVKEYTEYFKSAKAEDIFTWQDDKKIEVEFNSKKLISFVFSDIEFRNGGAIGSGPITYYNFDLTHNRLVTFPELVDTSKMKELSQILKDSYRLTLSKEDNNQSLKALGWESNKMTITRNISITEKGINFLYSRFENVPFATGLIIFVPYKKLEGILKPNTILTMNLRNK
jgi:hypothetical protein